MNKYVILCAIMLFQGLGLSSALVVNGLPSYKTELDYARNNMDAKLMWNTIFKYSGLSFLAYWVWMLPSILAFFSREWKFPNLFKSKKIVALFCAFVGLFLMAGGQHYFFNFTGIALRDVDVLNYYMTPVALLLYMAGSAGIFTLYVVPKRLNKWLVLVLGLMLIVLSVIYVEFLFMWSYQKPY